jgi:hypothetical protein
MTRARCGLLVHIRMALTFATPRRFSRRTRRLAKLVFRLGPRFRDKSGYTLHEAI